MNELKIITLDGVEYVRRDSIENNIPAEKYKGMKYCIVRTYSAGVFAGYVKERNGKEGIIIDSRQLWYWDGACGLSQLAVDGTKCPDNCKFTKIVPVRELTEIIEILECSIKAQKSINEVKVWEK
jgi:hypothetical protein